MRLYRNTHLSIFALFTLSGIRLVNAGMDLGYGGGRDEDLTNFVTRPEIKAPRFNVSVYKPEQVVPGYWFIGTYANVMQESMAQSYYQPCQTGPAIYDQSGELVWSGACRFRNQNAVDFRTWKSNGTDYLSTILWIWNHIEDKKGHGVILDNSFAEISEVHVPKTMSHMNMHEFNIINDGRKALYITQRNAIIDFEAHNLDFEVDVGLISDLGFHEIELATGKILFEWWASDHISVNESTAEVSDLAGPWPKGWNWIHMNSVDKNDDGDYMISARYTNAIYKISEKDGSLLWTLGGLNSDFELEKGFNFSRQHDARFLSQTGDTEVITFMDNGGDDYNTTANSSSSLVVTLDKSAMVANVTKRWVKPDYSVTKARGNFQLLPNGNAFSAWSENCILSEHSWDGELLMEAMFSSHRFVTYRAYKSNFTSTPFWPPALAAFVYGTEPAKSTTVFYVSWNGATEVAFWNFYRIGANGNESLIGSKKKTGFETMLQVDGYEQVAFVEGVAADGSVLGRSETETTTITGEWDEYPIAGTLNATQGPDSRAGSIYLQKQDADHTHDPEKFIPFQTRDADIGGGAAWIPIEKTEL